MPTFDELQRARNVIFNSKRLIETSKFDGTLAVAVAEVLNWHDHLLKDADARLNEFISKAGEKTDGQTKDTGTTKDKSAA
jgi:hypothetical protein